MSARILVVEDEPDAVELLTYHLHQNGFEALTASSGIEALHKARRFLPDLIVLDLLLPDIDGFTVCEILRCQASTARIPVFILTALRSEFSRLHSLEVGPTNFFPSLSARANWSDTWRACCKAGNWRLNRKTSTRTWAGKATRRSVVGWRLRKNHRTRDQAILEVVSQRHAKCPPALVGGVNVFVGPFVIGDLISRIEQVLGGKLQS